MLRYLFFIIQFIFLLLIMISFSYAAVMILCFLLIITFYKPSSFNYPRIWRYVNTLCVWTNILTSLLISPLILEYHAIEIKIFQKLRKEFLADKVFLVISVGIIRYYETQFLCTLSEVAVLTFSCSAWVFFTYLDDHVINPRKKFRLTRSL